MMERVRPFYDKPRQCLECWRFDHATAKCKNESVFRKCSETHAAASCSSADIACSNNQAAHLASNLQYPERSKEMEFLKYKAHNHLSITEARSRYTKTSKPKIYAKADKFGIEPSPNAMYVTKTDLELTLELFFQHVQESNLQIMQQQTQLFV